MEGLNYNLEARPIGNVCEWVKVRILIVGSRCDDALDWVVVCNHGWPRILTDLLGIIDEPLNTLKSAKVFWGDQCIPRNE